MVENSLISRQAFSGTYLPIVLFTSISFLHRPGKSCEFLLSLGSTLIEAILNLPIAVKATQHIMTHGDFSEARGMADLICFVSRAVNMQGRSRPNELRFLAMVHLEGWHAAEIANESVTYFHASVQNVDDVTADRAPLGVGPYPDFAGFFFRTIDQQRGSHDLFHLVARILWDVARVHGVSGRPRVTGA
jgi:hypothetical protein